MTTPAASRRTLIVEDDDTSRRLLATLLLRLGHETETAATLAEGMAKLHDWRPRCVLLDLMLPDGSGADLLRRVRSQHLPVKVAVTSGAFGRILEQAHALGPDAYFPKPLDLKRLNAWLSDAAC